MKWAPAIAILWLAWPAAAMDGRVQASDRSEARVIDWNNGTPTSREAETDLVGELDLRSRTTEARLAYTPRLILRDVASTFQSEILHAGVAEATWHRTRTTLTLHEDGGYGQANVTSLAAPAAGGPAGGPAILVTQPFTLRYGTTTSSIGIVRAATRTLSLSLTTEVAVGGGLDDTSRAVLPLRRAETAVLGSVVRLSARDAFESNLSASEVDYSNGPTYLVFTAKQGLTRKLTRFTDLRLFAGVAGVFGRISEGGSRVEKGYPVAGVQTTTRVIRGPDRYVLTLRAELGPDQNRAAGTVDQRGQAEARLAWGQGRWGTDVVVSGVSSVPRDQLGGVEQLWLSTGVSYRVSRIVMLDLGVRAVFLRLSGLDPSVAATSALERIAYIGIRFATPEPRRQ
jgi:hypothetical protein